MWYLHALGFLAALHAILTSRTPEGAVAWAVSLFAFPEFVLPIYLVFGRDRFHGYVQALRSGTFRKQASHVKAIMARIEEHRYDHPDLLVFEKLARVPFTGACEAELLIDGQNTFKRIFDLIESARDYVLVVFFIINNDQTGRDFRDHLCRKARQGVRVYLVYDEMGSHWLNSEYLAPLQEAGVHAFPFRTARGLRHRTQLNFRNHRKIVVADGKEAITGGINMEDSCLGYSRHYREWRDTGVAVRGPAVLGAQLVFLEDYYWATGGEIPELNWEPHCRPDGQLAAAYVASGPADSVEVGVLFFMECIRIAQKRLWLASPYFVPDPAVMQELKLADLRGVDVRIMIPPTRYEPHMRWAALAFLPELVETGIKLYEYHGYNHSKMMLIDDELAWVGSSNLDVRSLRLNFEGNLMIKGAPFAKEMEDMFERDFARSHLLDIERLRRYGLLTRFAVKFSRLFVPIL